MAAAAGRTRLAVDMTPLRGLYSELERKTVSLAGVRAAARVVTAAAKARAPRKTGLLKRSLGVRAKKGTKGALAFAVIGAKSSVKRESGGKPAQPSKYLHLVSGGTKAHRLFKGARTRGKAGEAQAKAEAAGLFDALARHPGSKPDPFMQNALSAAATAAGASGNAAMGKAVRGLLAKFEKQIQSFG